ncbi:MAG: alpha/beta fold hydrolase [Sphaerochaetaceae bacterium]|nr:alpha/beta fold hydrolase [Sphaerochaetaceae bacterium]
MKKLSVIVLLSLFIIFSASSTSMVGQTWSGKLIGQLDLIVHFNSETTGTVDVPQQNTKGLRITYKLEKESLSFKFSDIVADYEGIVNDNQINGTFHQNGGSLPLNFTKQETSLSSEITIPENFISEDVQFFNKQAGIFLAGTITRPKDFKFHTAVILISGSGLQDRDETILGKRPFYNISTALSNAGFVVLRFDDRGYGESQGDSTNATTEDFATDVSSAVDFLLTKNYVNKKKIGLIGHSEGGIIAPMVATQRNDIDFIILLAGPGVDGKTLILNQSKVILEKSNASKDYIDAISKVNEKIYDTVLNNSISTDEKETIIENLLSNLGMEKNAIDANIATSLIPWTRFFLALDPSIYLKQIKIPVLSLNGSLDTQVTAELNQSGIKKALDKAGNKHYEIKKLDGYNHLFQKANTGLTNEYATLGKSMDNEVCNILINFIQKQ